MLLLARYHLDRDSRLSLHLLDLETSEPVNVITPFDDPTQALLTTAKTWAAAHGHTITEIDNQVLR